MRIHKTTIVLLWVLSCIPIFSWSQSDIYGKVLDEKTQKPIPFVNIGFVDEGIGSTTNEDGDFVLDFRFSELSSESVLQISSLGYLTKKIPVEAVKSFTGKELNIYLEPSDIQMNEVIVYNDGQEFIPDNIGYKAFGVHYGYWKDDVALGGELATRIMAKDGLRKLHSLSFIVKQAPKDSVLLRINIYDDDGGKYRMPGTNLNKSGKNILCTLQSYTERVKIDLNPYDIVVHGDFIVSLELVKYYGDSTPELAIMAESQGLGSYRKYTSQDQWVKFSSTNMAYSLETSLLVSKRLVEKYKLKESKLEKKKRYVSGFVIVGGKMIADVEVSNIITGETVYSDSSGRYRIHAEKEEILEFSKDGYETLAKQVSKKPTLNASLRRTLE